MDLNAPQRPDEVVDLDRVRIDSGLALRVPESLARRRRILPFGQDARGVVVACEDPADHGAIEAVERALAATVRVVRVTPASLDRALQRVFPQREAPRGDEFVRLVDELLATAVLEQASDLHIEPERDAARVRCRVDGVLENVRTLTHEQLPGVGNRVKVLAGMDIGERRLPQDGRFSFAAGGVGARRDIDVRVACIPTRFGERLTLRLLWTPEHVGTLAGLGMAPAGLAALQLALGAAHGLVLLTGPTGSGKTTTLYAGLRSLDRERLNVLTIEDPIECELPGVSQVEVDSGDRISFPRALRSLLRHDPDVLMIGEIRDLETAEVAVRAALTGHLVLSTLHTNSAAGVVARLADLGVPPYLIGAALRLAVAQRLVRRLCVHCRRLRPCTAAESATLDLPVDAPVHDAVGCAYCRGSGYVGRTGLFEVLVPDSALLSRLRGGQATAPEPDGGGLRRDGARCVLAGITTVAEVLSATEGC